MAIPNEALQKVSTASCISLTPGLCFLIRLQLALEIESQALTAQREINIVKTAVAAKQRDIRMLELTSSEMKSLDKNTKIYQGVGKM